MSLECGILGYLSIKDLSGYDLKKLFDMSAAYFWPADQAQIYRSLKKLLEDSAIDLKEPSLDLEDRRKIYQITDKGRTILHDWIVNPKESDFISRLPFLMQLFFSGTLSREEQLGFIEKQMEMNQRTLKMLKENYAENYQRFLSVSEMAAEDRSIKSATYAHRWGILRGEAYAKLLEEIKEELT